MRRGDAVCLLKRNVKTESRKTKYEFQAALSPKITLQSRAGVLLGQRTQWLLVIGLTGLAFLMRRKGLATQSLWFDEADLVSRASQDLPTILKGFVKAGENGPLYTLFMHFWQQFAGTGEAAVRAPSMLAGTAAVPLMFLVGRKLGGAALGLLGAFLLTISPYHLWYSQDAKMYPLALCFTLASVYLFLRGLESTHKGWWFAYVIITTLGLYIHLMTVLIIAVEIVYFLINSRLTRNSKLTHRRALISFGLLTLPYLPIALWQIVALWDGTVGNGWSQPIGLLDIFNTLGRRFGVNRSSEPWESLGAIAFALLAGFGLFAKYQVSSNKYQEKSEVGSIKSESTRNPQLATRNSSSSTTLKPSVLSPQSSALFLTIYLLLPVLAFYLLTMRLPLFADRYLLIASPAYYLLVAGGLLWLLEKFWPIAVVLLAAGLTCILVSLQSYNYSSTVHKEDWRESMRWLSEQVRPGDEVFVIPGYLDTAVKYYFKPGFDVPLITLPGDLLDDRDDVQLNDFLQKAIRGHERAWLVVSPERYVQADPKEFVRKVWFDYNTFMFSHPEVKVGVNVYGYAFKLIPGTNADFFAKTSRLNYQFGESLKLEGYDYASSNNLPAGTVRYGENLHLTTFWRKLDFSKTSYVIKTRLLDKAGNDTGTNYASLPLNGYYTSDQWRGREAVRDYRELFIHVPPGEYQLELTIYANDNPDVPISINGAEQGTNVEEANRVIFNKPITVLPAQGK